MMRIWKQYLINALFKPLSKLLVSPSHLAHIRSIYNVLPTMSKMGTGSFPGVKRPGRGVDHLPQSSANVKGRVELYLYSPASIFVACYVVKFTFICLQNKRSICKNISFLLKPLKIKFFFFFTFKLYLCFGFRGNPTVSFPETPLDVTTTPLVA
jgi:hypothetical protein